MSALIDVTSNEVRFEHGNPVKDTDVRNAENQLDIMFADDYKEYLLTYGVGGWESHELTGLGCTERVNVVNVTIEEQKRRQVPLQGMYVIEQANIDRIVIWQDINGKIYQTMRDSEPIFLCHSLAEYIKL